MSIQKSLAELGDRVHKARDELRIIEEQVLFQADVVEDAKTRAVVAETPLAEREYREARDDLSRLHKEAGRIRQEIADLQKEQDRLLDRMLSA